MNNDQKFLSLIKAGIQDNWDRPALTDMGGRSYLYSDFAEEMAKLHILLERKGVKKGDKVAICGKNSANWAICFFATMGYGAVITSILHDFHTENIQNIINHSDSKFFFVSEPIWDRLDARQMPKMETAVSIENLNIIHSQNEEEDKKINIEASFIEKHPNGFSKADIIMHDEDPEDLAMLNYTSGTTSAPKGVMLPYRSLWSNTRFAVDRLEFVKPGDGVVCMLPMAHMYGLAFEVLLSIAKGCHINFLTRVPTPQILLGAFQEVNPTIVLAVPLIIEKIIQNKVFAELNKQPAKTLIKIPFFKNIIYKKVAKQLIPIFGNKMNEVIIGGAALNKEVGQFLTDIKFPYTIGYGMTECGPLISYAYWSEYTVESCGKDIDRMRIKIDSSNPLTETGEILVKGTNTMLGYYKNEEVSKEAFDAEGWLKTGDLGVMDAEGSLFIKGRSKTMILGASGQNIYPEEIEDLFNNSPYIAESLVIEEKGRLIALLYPDMDYMEAHSVDQKNYPRVFSDIQKMINKRLPNYSQITNFRIQEQEFEKTPKRSIKRFLYQKEN